MADDAVVAAAKLGDPDAWQTLYRAHAGRLQLWLRTRPPLDAAVGPDDVAAEAWLVAARRLVDFEGGCEEFAGWLFGIARKVAANESRRGRHRCHDEFDALEEADHARGRVDGPEVVIPGTAWVREVLAGLPPRERDVLACLDVVGFDVETTARALGMSAVAVRVARHRGLKRLRGATRRPSVQPSPAA